MTAFYATGFGVKCPCEMSWQSLQKLLYIEKNLYQRAKLIGLPLIC